VSILWLPCQSFMDVNTSKYEIKHRLLGQGNEDHTIM
jgi:hypothetical protein